MERVYDFSSASHFKRIYEEDEDKQAATNHQNNSFSWNLAAADANPLREKTLLVRWKTSLK